MTLCLMVYRLCGNVHKATWGKTALHPVNGMHGIVAKLQNKILIFFG